LKIDTTPDFLESVANHPRVYPYVSVKGCGYIRFGKIWDDCIAVVFDTGGWLFHRQDHNVYEVHTMFLPKSRDVNAKALRALGYMFDEAGADLIVTQIAGDLPHVRRLALRAGFEKTGHQDAAWERDSGPVNVDYFHITRDMWKQRT
jgi:hypothetical protein